MVVQCHFGNRKWPDQHEGGGVALDAVARPDPGEDGVNEAELGRGGGNVAAHLGHDLQGSKAILAFNHEPELL